VYREKGLLDITLDEPVLRFLSHSELPKDDLDVGRVLRAAQFAQMDEGGRVWLKGTAETPARLVPGIGSR
jgi:hypothetical protein